MSCLLLILQSGRATAQDFSSIDSLLSSMIAGERFSGSVLVAKNGNIIYEKRGGFSNRENRQPLTEGISSNIASVGKVFAATIIMKLQQDGKINTKDIIGKYLPDAIPFSDQITIHQLLTHTAGLNNYMMTKEYWAIRNNEKLTLDDIIAIIAQQARVTAKPGEKHVYSNSGYILLGKIIEKVTGQSYGSVLQDQIFGPLNMNRSSMTVDLKWEKQARGYIRGDKENEWRTQKDLPVPQSDGGLYSTTRDLLVFDQALFKEKLIGKSLLDLMTRPHVKADLPGMGPMEYAYGLMRFDLGGGSFCIGHNGGYPGYNAEYKHYFLSNGNEYTVIIMANYDRVIRPVLLNIQAILLKS